MKITNIAIILISISILFATGCGQQGASTSSTSIEAAPSSLSISVSGSGKLTLSWEANTETNVAGYNVYRSLRLEGFTKINSSVIETTTYEDTGLTNLTTYYYKITATNATGSESSFSDIVSKEALPWITSFSVDEIPSLANALYLAVDSEDNLYLSYGATDRAIKEYDSEGNYLQQIGERGDSEGQFASIGGSAINSLGNIYVTDWIHPQTATANFHNRILVFNSAGTLINSWGETGSGEGQFLNPKNIAIDSSNNVYVLENDLYGLPKHNRVQKFDEDGNFISMFGTEECQFVGTGITIDQSGKIYIADYSNHRIIKFSNSGALEATWGSEGPEDGQFASGYLDIAFSPSGYIYATDNGNNRIQKFDTDGTFISKLASDYATGNGNFYSPWGIATPSSGYLYLLDRQRNILKFEVF